MSNPSTDFRTWIFEKSLALISTCAVALLRNVDHSRKPGRVANPIVSKLRLGNIVNLAITSISGALLLTRGRYLNIFNGTHNCTVARAGYVSRRRQDTDGLKSDRKRMYRPTLSSLPMTLLGFNSGLRGCNWARRP
jgi:hypothetical protein